MHPENHLDARFGSDAARRLAGLLGLPPAGDSSFSPASQDRCRGALLGSVAGEALPVFLMNKRPAVGADTRVTLIAADALLSGVHDHPVRLAARRVQLGWSRRGSQIPRLRTSLVGRPCPGSLGGRTLRDRHAWPSSRDRRCRRLRRRQGERPARQSVAGRCGGHLRGIPSGRRLRHHRGGPDSADPGHPPRRPDGRTARDRALRARHRRHPGRAAGCHRSARHRRVPDRHEPGSASHRRAASGLPGDDGRLHRGAARRERVDVLGGHAATAGHPA